MKSLLFNQFPRIAMGLALMSVALGVAAEEPAKVAPYLLPTCPVSGSELGAMGEPVSKIYDGKQIKFCCGGCPAKYEADPGKYDAQIKAQLTALQTPYYPLDTCVVSGEKLGSKGEPVDYIDGSTLVRFCCKDCVPKFQKNPDDYRSALDKAVADKQRSDYPLETCVVSGDKLGGNMGDPIDYVVGNRLIRLCCKDCVKDVAKNPAKYLQMIDKAQHGGSTKQPGNADSHHEHASGGHK